MSWYLRFNTTTCYVSIPTGQNADAGQSTWTFGAKLKISAYPSASAGILGTNGTTSKNGFAISNQGALEIWHNNTLRASSPAFVVPLNQEVEIQIGHLISGETAWSINGSVVHNSTFNTAGLTWVGTNTLNAIGKLSSSDTTLQMDLKEVRTEGMQNSRTWSAPLSNGTGTTLPTTNGTNQGTLLNFTSPIWVSDAPNKPLKYHNGTTWVTKPLKYFNGTAWVTKPLKYHNGTSWS